MGENINIDKPKTGSQNQMAVELEIWFKRMIGFLSVGKLVYILAMAPSHIMNMSLVEEL